MCLDSFLSARSMHDVAWYCAMNYVRSRDAQKQLARTSLNRFCNILEQADTSSCQDYEEYEFVEYLSEETQIIDLFTHKVTTT